MEMRVRLLINKAMLFNFSWDDLENYLSLRKDILIEELNKFFKGKEDSKIRVDAILQRIQENERQRKMRMKVVLER